MSNAVFKVFRGTAALKATEAVIKAAKAGSVDADDDLSDTTGHQEEMDDDRRKKSNMNDRSYKDAP